MSEDKTIILKYDGWALKDGSMEVSDLVNGLDGLVRLAAIIHPYIDGLKGTSPSLRIIGLEQGSCKAIIEWIEHHPVLVSAAVGTVVPIACAVIVVIASQITKSDKHYPSSSDEIQPLVEIVVAKHEKRIIQAFCSLTNPLSHDGIESTLIGTNRDLMYEVANENNYQAFHKHENITLTTHRSLTMEGSIRALNKKTMTGTFVGRNNKKVYPIILVMRNPENELHKFLWDHIRIRGVGTYDEDQILKKIEVEYIDDLM